MPDDSHVPLRTLLKGGTFILFGSLFELGIAFIAKLIIARFLEPPDYGLVSIGITVLSLTSMITLAGMHAGVGRYLPRYDEPAQRKGVLVAAFQIALPLSILSATVIVFGAGYISTNIFGNANLTPVLQIFGLAIPFAALLRLSTSGIQGLKRTLPRVVLQDIIRPIIRFTGVIVAVLTGWGTVGVSVAYAVAWVIPGSLGFVYIVKNTPLLSRVKSVPMHREMLLFSLPVLVTAAMSMLLADIDTLMLGYFKTPTDVGIYNVVYPLSEVLLVGLSAFSFLFMPVLSELHANNNLSQMRRVYQVVTKWIFLMTLPLFFVLLLFPSTVISLTFGSNYAAGGLALAILSVSFFIHVFAGPNGNTLTSIGQTRTIMWDNLLIAVQNILLNLLLIPRYSFLGAAIATAVSYASLNFLYSFQVYRRSGVHPLTPALLRPGLIATGTMAAFYVLIKYVVGVSVWSLVAGFGAYIFIYGVITIRFGGIEEEEIILILEFEERYDVDLGPVKTIGNWLMKGQR